MRLLRREAGKPRSIASGADERSTMAFAALVRATRVVVRAGFPHEIVIVLGEQVGAATPVADVAYHLVPGAVHILTLGERRNLGHRAFPLVGPLLSDAMPRASPREVATGVALQVVPCKHDPRCKWEGRPAGLQYS